MNGFAKYFFSVILSVVTAPKPAVGDSIPMNSTQFAKVEEAMGMMSLDGCLRLSLSLGESEELMKLGVRCRFEHLIEVNAHGEGVSAWRVKGLQSTLLPYGRDHLLWRPLGGVPLKFDVSEIGRAFPEKVPKRWRIRESRKGDYEIRSYDGVVWYYSKGVVTAAYHPVLGEIHFTTRGARITSIDRADVGPSVAPLLVADYDENGRLTLCRIGENKPRRLTWDELGFLKTWHDSESEVAFVYFKGLLSEVTDKSKGTHRFNWEKNTGFGRGDSRWTAPLHLTSDGTSTYTCEISTRGFDFRRIETSSGHVTSVCFNPRRYRLERRGEGENLILSFSKDSANWGALEQVENGLGEVLEKYRYDERGLLVEVHRKGEQTKTLRYDPSGRLMRIEE